MKMILFAEEWLYQELYQAYSVTIDGKRSSFFSRDESYLLHSQKKDHINFALDTVGGIKNVTHILLQRSLYGNEEILSILQRIRLLRPSIYTVLIMDQYNEIDPLDALFISEIVKESLAFFCFQAANLGELFERNFNISYADRIIEKYKKKDRLRMLRS